jgi:transposase
MTERPEALTRVDGFLSTSSIAHEAIFDLHRKLASAGRDDPRTRDLLAESARIALQDLPELTAAARRLQVRWDEQSVLDPEHADRTLEAVRSELPRVEPEIRRLLGRQKAIARQLRSLIEG